MATSWSNFQTHLKVQMAEGRAMVGRTDGMTGGRTNRRTDGRMEGRADPLLGMLGRTLKVMEN